MHCKSWEGCHGWNGGQHGERHCIGAAMPVVTVGKDDLNPCACTRRGIQSKDGSLCGCSLGMPDAPWPHLECCEHQNCSVCVYHTLNELVDSPKGRKVVYPAATRMKSNRFHWLRK